MTDGPLDSDGIRQRLSMAIRYGEKYGRVVDGPRLRRLLEVDLPAMLAELDAERAKTAGGEWETQVGRDYGDEIDGTPYAVEPRRAELLATNVTRRVWFGPWSPKYATSADAMAALRTSLADKRAAEAVATAEAADGTQ